MHNHQYLKYKNKYLNLKQQQNIQIPIKQPWYNFIKLKQKTVEGRLNKGIFSKLNSGDIITFIHKKLKLQVVVTYINHYKSFEELLMTEGINKTLPNTESIDDGVNIYHQFYTKEDEQQFGVIGIGLELKDKQITIHVIHFTGSDNDFTKNKRFELKINDNKLKDMNIGDVVMLEYDKKLIETQIVQIKTFIIQLESCNKINKDNMFFLHISEPWLTLIKNGKKIVEGRKGDKNKFKKHISEYAIFFNKNLAILVLIKDVRHYDTLIDYLNTEGLQKVAPQFGDNFDKVVEEYHKFGSDEEIEKVGGFNGIEVEVIGTLL